jgi:hypothetical protein
VPLPRAAFLFPLNHVLLNEVVEVHQVGSKDQLLHYRRVTVSRGTINFEGSQRYDSSAAWPAVSLLDNGLVVELDIPEGDTVENGPLYARTGTLNPSNPEIIDWSDSVRIGNDDTHEFYPAVASNGSYAIATWQTVNSILFSSVATIP